MPKSSQHVGMANERNREVARRHQMRDTIRRRSSIATTTNTDDKNNENNNMATTSARRSPFSRSYSRTHSRSNSRSRAPAYQQSYDYSQPQSQYHHYDYDYDYPQSPYPQDASSVNTMAPSFAKTAQSIGCSASSIFAVDSMPPVHRSKEPVGATLQVKKVYLGRAPEGQRYDEQKAMQRTPHALEPPECRYARLEARGMYRHHNHSQRRNHVAEDPSVAQSVLHNNRDKEDDGDDDDDDHLLSAEIQQYIQVIQMQRNAITFLQLQVQRLENRNAFLEGRLQMQNEDRDDVPFGKPQQDMDTLLQPSSHHRTRATSQASTSSSTSSQISVQWHHNKNPPCETNHPASRQDLLLEDVYAVSELLDANHAPQQLAGLQIPCNDDKSLDYSTTTDRKRVRNLIVVLRGHENTKYSGPVVASQHDPTQSLPHGMGIARFMSGDTYCGEFRHGEIHGMGTWYAKEPAVKEEDWERHEYDGGAYDML